MIWNLSPGERQSVSTRAATAGIATLQFVLVVALGLLTVTAPPATAEGEQPCTYNLSAPRMARLPGGPDVVIATIQAIRCSDPWQASSAVVCIAPEASGGKCAEGWGYDRVEVHYAPTQSSSFYTAAGKGCATSGNPSQVKCAPLGPIRVAVR